jgi:hypothetical protein
MALAGAKKKKSAAVSEERAGCYEAYKKRLVSRSGYEGARAAITTPHISIFMGKPCGWRSAGSCIDSTSPSYHAFGVIGTALSKKISVFHSSSLKVVPITPNAS